MRGPASPCGALDRYLLLSYKISRFALALPELVHNMLWQFIILNMAERKQPTTPDEIQVDIENHPERGKVKDDNGELVPIVRLDLVELRGNISRESYRLLLEMWGAKGLDKTDGLKDLVNQYLSNPGNLSLLERAERMKSEVYGISKKEVRSKTFGYYKDKGRRSRSNLKSSKDSITSKAGEEG